MPAWRGLLAAMLTAVFASPSATQSQAVICALVAGQVASAEYRMVGCRVTDRGWLRGVGAPVAVVTWTSENAGGGSRWFADLAVAMPQGAGVRLLTVPDPIEAFLPVVIRRARIVGGRVLVQGVSLGSDDGNCCPSNPVLVRLVPDATRDGLMIAALPARRSVPRTLPPHATPQ